MYVGQGCSRTSVRSSNLPLKHFSNALASIQHSQSINLQPVSGSRTPSGTHLQPVSGSRTPSGTHLQPASGSRTPSGTHLQPASGSRTPSGTHLQPESGSRTPSGTHLQPASGSRTPSGTHLQPASGSRTPSGTHLQPASGSRTPSGTHLQPASGSRTPSGTHLQPASGSRTPSGTHLQPASGSRTPSGTHLQPASGSRTPSGTHLQPASGSRTPSGTHLQPVSGSLTRLPLSASSSNRSDSHFAVRTTLSSATDICQQALLPLQLSEKLRLLTILFSKAACAQFSFPAVPPDFLALAANSMQHLHCAGRSNIVYNLAYAFGTLRRDGTDTLLPVSRMPTGLIEYAVAFFCASSLQKVCLVSCMYIHMGIYSFVLRFPAIHIVHDIILGYEGTKQWLTTMYSQFGNKWANLHVGPMWSVVPVGQGTITQLITPWM